MLYFISSFSKRALFIFLLPLSLFAQTICLNMIVKDEAHVICRCLDSVRPLIDYWVIVDTGSTDGTQEIIREHMKDIPGKLYQSTWVNFEHNRNEALNFAKGKADYTLFIDADEELVYEEDFSLPLLDQDLYYISVDFASLHYRRAQLVKDSLTWGWEGVVHETINAPNIKTRSTLKGVTNIPRSEGARSHDPQKFQKDAKLLEDALKKDPMNSRYAFYLAQSYRDANLHQKSIDAYEKRIAMGGWDQEVFWSMYQIARLKESIEAPFNTVINAYTRAYQYRPTRAEPLYQLARYLRAHDNNFLGHLVASWASSIPMTSDTLFIEKWIYDWGALLEKAVNAYWLGNYHESLKIHQHLLKTKELPSDTKVLVERNIGFAVDKISPSVSSEHAKSD